MPASRSAPNCRSQRLARRGPRRVAPRRPRGPPRAGAGAARPTRRPRARQDVPRCRPRPGRRWPSRGSRTRPGRRRSSKPPQHRTSHRRRRWSGPTGPIIRPPHDTQRRARVAERLVGSNYTTPDLVAKVTGRARYAEDFRAEGMLFCKLLLSPVPHGRVRRVGLDKALALPGVRGVIRAADLPDMGCGPSGPVQGPRKSAAAFDAARPSGQTGHSPGPAPPAACPVRQRRWAAARSGSDASR